MQAARSVSVEERAALQELETNGPGMIDEGPHGWSITALGRKVLQSGRVIPLSPEQLLFSVGAILATAENAAWADGEEYMAA